MIALLVVLSVITEAPLWLLVFPLLFLRESPRRQVRTSAHGRADYRRPDRSPGW